MALYGITGAAGYLGHQIAATLAANGKRVRALDILDLEQAGLSLPGVETRRVDVLHPGALLDAVRGVEVLIHTAALVPLNKAGQRYWRVNVEGTDNALHAARRSGVKLFIHVSSSAVFGLPDRCPIDENTPLRPIETYGRSKLEAETRVNEAAREGLPCAIVRPRTILGPGRLGIFEILFDWITQGKRIYVLGDGNQLFQFVHSRDLIDFILLLAERRATGTFNIGAARYGTLREDLTGLIQHAGSESVVTGIPAHLAMGVLGLLDRIRLCPLSPWHYRTYHKAFYFDLSKPLRELAWQPRYSNLESLVESYQWFLQRRGNREPSPGERSTHRKSVPRGILEVLKLIS